MGSGPVTLDALEELLSRPTPEVERCLARVPGPLLVLGAGGKMGPTLARMAARAGAEVTAVSRFAEAALRTRLEEWGVHTITADLLDRRAVEALPHAGAVLFLAGTKFGTGADPVATWAHNALLPALVAERYAGVPTVAFSSGNVYPLVAADGPGADEQTPPAPAGEYAWSVLARERVFEHAARRFRTPVLILRLNYAVELRYGVTVDIARRVAAGEPVDVTMGRVNLIWQADASRVALRALELAATPARVLNVTGDGSVSVRDLAQRLGAALGRAPTFRGAEAATALLSDAGRCAEHFGPSRVGLDELVTWTADWLAAGGELLEQPTHFEVRDGAY